ncbi:MAG: hypothetical protein QXG17_05610 [Sulfolobales archaeon]
MDEMLKAQLKLSLEVLSSTLTFLASPHMTETIRRFCQDRDFYETLKKVSNAIQAVEYSCYGMPRAEMVKRLVSEIKRCSDLECVRKVVEEYEEILGISHTP